MAQVVSRALGLNGEVLCMVKVSDECPRSEDQWTASLCGYLLRLAWNLTALHDARPSIFQTQVCAAVGAQVSLQGHHDNKRCNLGRNQVDLPHQVQSPKLTGWWETHSPDGVRASCWGSIPPVGVLIPNTALM